MRRKEKLVTDKELLGTVIRRSSHGRLAMIDGSKPYVVPLTFGFDGTHLYFHSADSGRKVAILRHNRCVCVEFEQDIALMKAEKACRWGFRFFTVICDGVANPVTDIAEKRYGLQVIVKHLEPQGEVPAFTEKDLQAVLVYRITLLDMTGKISGWELPQGGPDR